MGITRKLTTLVGVVASLAAAGTAGAQGTFNYFTTGQFSGAPTCSGPAAATASCTGGGVTLNFAGVPASAFGYQSGSQITYGTFTPTGLGSQTVPSNIYFTLFVNQIDPTNNSSSVVGSIGGYLQLKPMCTSPSQPANTCGASSSLYWLPQPNSFNIDNVNYRLESSQGVLLDSLTIGAQGATSINGRAFVSTVPEPSSMALLGTGLFGLVPMVRRRKK